MKKWNKAILAALLAAIMVVTSVIPASAAIITQNDEEIGTKSNPAFVPTYAKTYSAYTKAKKNPAELSIIFEPDEKTVIVPIDVPAKGTLHMELTEGENDVPLSSLSGNLYTDKACTSSISSSYLSLYGTSVVDSKDVPFGKAQRIYLKLELYRKYGDNSPMEFLLSAYEVAGTDRALTADANYIAAFSSDYNESLYKVTVPKDGIITFKVTSTDAESFYSYFTLLNSKKKALTDNSYSVKSELTSDGNQYAATKTFAVKKGTYYVKLKISGAWKDIFVLRYSTKAVTNQGGATKKEATAMAIGGKTKVGLLAASDKEATAKWYKVTLKKKQDFQITINGKGDFDYGLVYVDVIDAKTGKTLLFGSRSLDEGANVFQTDKLTAGTYYFKVYKKKATGNAYFTIRLDSIK